METKRVKGTKVASVKAIFVDGSSCWAMLRGVLEIGKSSHQVLYDILVDEIGSAENSFGRPVYVLSPRGISNEKSLKTAGFDVQIIETKGSQDDKYIVDQINRLNSEQVSEIILVSADIQDYLNALSAKHDQGIKIVIVATKTKYPNGRSVLTESFDQIIEDLEALFFDLADFKDRLMLEPKRENFEDMDDDTRYGEIRHSGGYSGRRVFGSLQFSFGKYDASAELMAELSNVLKHYNGI